MYSWLGHTTPIRSRVVSYHPAKKNYRSIDRSIDRSLYLLMTISHAPVHLLPESRRYSGRLRAPWLPGARRCRPHRDPHAWPDDSSPSLPACSSWWPSWPHHDRARSDSSSSSCRDPIPSRRSSQPGKGGRRGRGTYSTYFSLPLTWVVGGGGTRGTREGKGGGQGGRRLQESNLAKSNGVIGIRDNYVPLK